MPSSHPFLKRGEISCSLFADFLSWVVGQCWCLLSWKLFVWTVVWGTFLCLLECYTALSKLWEPLFRFMLSQHTWNFMDISESGGNAISRSRRITEGQALVDETEDWNSSAFSEASSCARIRTDHEPVTIKSTGSSSSNSSGSTSHSITFQPANRKFECGDQQVWLRLVVIIKLLKLILLLLYLESQFVVVHYPLRRVRNRSRHQIGSNKRCDIFFFLTFISAIPSTTSGVGFSGGGSGPKVKSPEGFFIYPMDCAVAGAGGGEMLKGPPTAECPLLYMWDLNWAWIGWLKNVSGGALHTNTCTDLLSASCENVFIRECFHHFTKSFINFDLR